MHMRFDNTKKKELVKGFRLHEKDTGSAAVQIALLTERINYLTKHFQFHKKDHHSRQGLLKIVNRRRKLLKYLKSRNPKRYSEVADSLGIRK